MALHTTLQWQQHNINETLNSQKTLHGLPSRASYGVSLWGFGKNWSRYNEIALYVECRSGLKHIKDSFIPPYSERVHRVTMGSYSIVSSVVACMRREWCTLQPLYWTTQITNHNVIILPERLFYISFALPCLRKAGGIVSGLAFQFSRTIKVCIRRSTIHFLMWGYPSMNPCRFFSRFDNFFFPKRKLLFGIVRAVTTLVSL